MKRAAIVTLGLALGSFASGCAPHNLLGRPVVATEEHVYTFQGETFSYIEGTSLEDKAADPTKRPKAYSERPVAVFIEGDGSECQSYSPTQWQHFVQHFAGDFVLVRAKTVVNVTCGTERFKKLDFLTRLDELDALLHDVASEHAGQPVVLVGDSAGATLAALYADKHADKVAAIVNLGGGLDSLDQVVKQVEREKGTHGRELREREAELDAAIQESTGGGSPTKPMWGRTEKFWGQMFSTSVKDVWLKLTMPVLVVHGQDDANVPFELMSKAKREFKRANKENFTFEFEEGKGHDLLSSDVFLAVNDWVLKNVKAGAPKSDAPKSDAPKGDAPKH